jgi:methanogenic corrinoid protein MtbC1
LKSPVLDEIRKCVVEIEIGRVRGLVREALNEGLPPYDIFTESIAKGMDVVGQKYEASEYFLTELLGAAQVVNEAMEELSPRLKGEAVKHTGKVVIGTVKGDIHDIGKNIVKMLLAPAGFEVHDLETDVPSERFAEKIGETNADIMAMSSLLTTTMHEMKSGVQALERAGLRQKVRVIIGGAPVTDDYAREIGADAAGKDAGQGVRICKEWMRT